MNTSMTIMTIATSAIITACGGPRYAIPSGNPTPVTPVAADEMIGIVRIPAPWYAPRSIIAGRFRSAVPEYEGITGLEKKYFTISDDRKFGGIYVWKTRADGESFYSDTWRKQIRERRGTDPDVLLLDVAFTVDGHTVIQGEPVGRRAVSYPATATLVLWDAGDDASGFARALSGPAIDSPGLMRAFVVVGPRRAGVVALWATRELAEKGLTRERLHLLAPDAPAITTYFDAPVLIDASLRVD